MRFLKTISIKQSYQTNVYETQFCHLKISSRQFWKKQISYIFRYATIFVFQNQSSSQLFLLVLLPAVYLPFIGVVRDAPAAGPRESHPDDAHPEDGWARVRGELGLDGAPRRSPRRELRSPRQGRHPRRLPLWIQLHRRIDRWALKLISFFVNRVHSIDLQTTNEYN